MTLIRGGLLPPMLAAAAAVAAVALLGALITDLGSWYHGLAKPTWQPPDWAFGPAWTLIFALAALSGYLAWRDAPTVQTRLWILGLFGINACLNVLWSALFFRAQRPDWALLEVALLWLSIALLIMTLRQVLRPASWLLVPYLAWVTFASMLNLAVVRLNQPF